METVPFKLLVIILACQVECIDKIRLGSFNIPTRAMSHGTHTKELGTDLPMLTAQCQGLFGELAGTTALNTKAAESFLKE